MQKEIVLDFIDNKGVPRGILLSRKGEIRSTKPKFLSTLTELEALILKANGLNLNEIAGVLMISMGTIRNSLHSLYIQNEKEYYELIKDAHELELLNPIAVRGIERALKEKFGIKEHPIIINNMEEAIKRKQIRRLHYTPLSIPLNEIRKKAGRIQPDRLFLLNQMPVSALVQR